MNHLTVKALSAGCALALSSALYAAPIDPQNTPKDPGVINQQRIAYWLEQRGEFVGLNEQQRLEKVRAYMGRADQMHRLAPGETDRLQVAKRSKVQAVRKQKSDAAKTVKVLGVLIDFPDLPHDNNRLTRSDTDMYYSSYPVSHYQNMLFSPTGFSGPSGQTLLSGHQYYLAESGGSLLYTGQMHGWVRADNNAAFYGGNNAEDDDKAAPALVTEAITKALANTANNINLNDYDVEDPSDLDNDGNLDEADGYIDHVSIFHSSIGEEAGGGVLGDDAIWSHRWSVYPAVEVTDQFGNKKRLFGYTIQPIDAATGVVVHEFGHDLGLPDEYDLGNSRDGEPIGFWSVMAGGAWAGSLPGSRPTAFSPYAREYFQQTFGGTWANQLVLTLDELKTANRTIDLVDALSHGSGYNQVRVDLPRPSVTFTAPYQGEYQYYSAKRDMTTSTLSFSAPVPNADSAELRIKAHWQIEEDWDYAIVKVNGQVLAGNHTKATNPLPERPGIINYISGNSSAIAGAEGSLGWVDLVFSLTAYKGQTVDVQIEYITDQSVLEKGLVIDGIRITDGTNVSFTDDAETEGAVTLSEFRRVGSTLEGEPQNYWLQLRSHADNDRGLADESYSPGVTLWKGDQNYSDNNVGDHPGHGYLSVVDADQVRIGSGDSSVQVRDAAFSRLTQMASNNDNRLDAIFSFDDSRDYSAPSQPQAGSVLPVHGLRFEVTAQSSNSRSATVAITAMPLPLVSAFSFTTNNKQVTFSNISSGGTGQKTYLWNFGDNNTSTSAAPSHTYAADGSYTVTLEVRDANNVSHSSSQTVTISTAVTPPPTTTPPASSGGGGGGSMPLALGLLALLALGRRRH